MIKHLHTNRDLYNKKINIKDFDASLKINIINITKKKKKETKAISIFSQNSFDHKQFLMKNDVKNYIF